MRRLWTDRTLRRWTAAWAGGAVLGVVNGAVRELTYRDRAGETAANRISAATLAALLGLYFRSLQRRWPLGSTRDALSVGAAWAALTILFEFGFGHYVDGKSWEELLENYDLRKGNLWTLVLLWIATGPAVARTADASFERWEKPHAA